MLTAMAAAGLGGYVLAGINNTRRGEALARDILRADCRLLLTDAAHHWTARRRLHLPGVRILDVDSAEMDRAASRTLRSGPAPGGVAHRHLHADLHVGHQ